MRGRRGTTASVFPNLPLSSFFFPRLPRARPGAAASELGRLASQAAEQAGRPAVVAGRLRVEGRLKTQLTQKAHECQGSGGSLRPPNTYNWRPALGWGGDCP